MDPAGGADGDADAAGELVWDVWNEPHLTALRPTRLVVGRAEVDALYESGCFVPADYEHLNPDGSWEWQVRLIGRTPAGRLLTVACQIAQRAPGAGWP